MLALILTDFTHFVRTTYALASGKQILPDRSKYQVLSTKIEIRLVKAEVINWTSLEYCKEITVPQKINVPSGRPNTHSGWYSWFIYYHMVH